MKSEITAVRLSPDLKAMVRQEAADKGTSMGAIIRWALRDRYRQQAKEAGIKVSFPFPQECSG